MRHAAKSSEQDQKESKARFTLLNSPFIQPILAHGLHTKVTEAAAADLYRFKMSKLYKKEKIDLKEIMAQMLLAMHALHSRNIVHRDPTLKNFFVELTIDQHLHVMLADLDGVLEKDAKNREMIGPPAPYTAPEFRKTFQIESNQKRTKSYNRIDKKAADCFSLGQAFRLLFKRYDHKEPPELENLILQLTKKIPKVRLTIEGAMEHAFFGKTSEIRKAYFDVVNKKFQKSDVYFGGFLQRPEDRFPKRNNYFYVMAHKEIFLVASDLQEALTLASELDAKQYHETYDNLLKQIAVKSQHLFQLASDVIPSTDLMKEIKNKAYDTYNSIPLEVPPKLITSSLLSAAVNRAVKNYIDVNGMQNLKKGDRFFERLYSHGVTGKERAVNFQTKIQELENSGSSPYKLYSEIIQHLRSGPGNHGKTSFKTVLTQEILKLAWLLPHKTLMENLSRTEQPTIESEHKHRR